MIERGLPSTAKITAFRPGLHNPQAWESAWESLLKRVSWHTALRKELVGGRADLQRHHQQLLLQVGANRWEYDHAKLEGAFRRLAVPNPSQYDEEAYSEALTDCLEAIKRFIMHTR